MKEMDITASSGAKNKTGEKKKKSKKGIFLSSGENGSFLINGIIFISAEALKLRSWPPMGGKSVKVEAVAFYFHIKFRTR